MKTAEIEDELDTGTPDEALEDAHLEDDPEGEDDAADEEDGEELVVSFGEDTPPQQEDKAPQWVRDLRVKNRELARENRELKALKEQVEQQKKTQLGPKPTLEGCDFDPERYEKELDSWKERKAQEDRRQEEVKKAEAERQKYFQSKYDAYSTRKAEVSGKLKDFEEVEEAVKDAFNETQLGVVLAHAKDPALLLYAIGKDEKRLAELAKISDPVEYIFAVARMETQLKTTSRKPSAAPEKPVRGSASASGADKQLDKLYEEAARTGSLDKVRAYKAARKSK